MSKHITEVELNYILYYKASFQPLYCVQKNKAWLI